LPEERKKDRMEIKKKHGSNTLADLLTMGNMVNSDHGCKNIYCGCEKKRRKKEIEIELGFLI
jgi:hypothetical protein